MAVWDALYFFSLVHLVNNHFLSFYYVSSTGIELGNTMMANIEKFLL